MLLKINMFYVGVIFQEMVLDIMMANYTMIMIVVYSLLKHVPRECLMIRFFLELYLFVDIEAAQS